MPRHYVYLALAFGIAATSVSGSATGGKQRVDRTSTPMTYYAAPIGSGSTCTLVAPCALTTAQGLVRRHTTSMDNDIVVNLRGGTYHLSHPLIFSSALGDSGQHGYNVIYQAYPGETPVLSGGRTISGWRLHDRARHIWQAAVGALQTRQLYVDGRRAVRAYGATSGIDWTQTAAGYTVPRTLFLHWHHPDDLEFVYMGGAGNPHASWVETRCGVARIDNTATATTVTMREPCYHNATIPSGYPNGVGLPTSIENAYELLDRAGEWYLDTHVGTLYYIPQRGENMATTRVIAPVLQALMEGVGRQDRPVHNIAFTGITFADTTWLAPSGDDGFVEQQANVIMTGPTRTINTMVPASVSFTRAQNIRVARDLFTHLGTVGLSFDQGSQNDLVIGNVFTDIAATGVQIGNWRAPNPPAAEQNRGIQVIDNDIHNVAAEYHGGVGIFVGFAADTTIAHNEVSDQPYTGISFGGVGPGNRSYAAHNTISSNYIHDIMKILNDGGCIYTLGASPTSTMSLNYVTGDYADSGALYLDTKSAGWTVTQNVVGPVATDWLLLQTDINYPGAARNNTVEHNYSFVSGINTPFQGTYDRSNTIRENQVGLTRFPPAAQAIMHHAGPEPASYSVVTRH